MDFLRTVYPNNILTTIKKARKQKELDCLKGCDELWHNLTVGWIIYWAVLFVDNNCMIPDDDIRIIINQCFPFLADIIPIRDVQNQILNQVRNANDLQLQDEKTAYYKQRWLPTLDYTKLLKHYAIPKLTKSQVLYVYHL